MKTLQKLEAGTLTATKQDDSKSCYAKLLTKAMGQIDWNQSALSIDRQVRGLYSWPGAYTSCKGKMLKIWQAKPVEEEGIAAYSMPGSIARVTKNEIFVQTGDGVLLRLSWMYDSLTENELAKGRRNLATMLREMLDKKQSRKFSDTDHRGVTDVTLVVKNMEAAWKLPGGIYNYGSSNDTNMYETVRRVMASFGQEALAEKATGGNVRNLMMRTDKLARHGIFFPDTAAGLEAFLRKGGAL